jgi:hypothetical protein
MSIALFLATALIAAAPIDPVYLSSVHSGHLAQTCEGEITDLTEGMCTDYILGVFDAMAFSKEICSTDSSKLTLTIVSVTKKYLRDHPEIWSRACLGHIQSARAAISLR